jgi:hypothetical protein
MAMNWIEPNSARSQDKFDLAACLDNWRQKIDIGRALFG